jgi:hypothetical protein
VFARARALIRRPRSQNLRALLWASVWKTNLEFINSLVLCGNQVYDSSCVAVVLIATVLILSG